VPLFRSKSHFRVPPLKLGPLILSIVAGVVIVVLAGLVLLEPRPPLRHFEVPISSDRFSH
jgi:hypothetical protein